MHESYETGDSVLCYDTPGNRARAEAGEELPAQAATIVEDVTPHGSKWDPYDRVEADGTVSHGRYVDSGPQGDAVYRVELADGAQVNVSVHQLMAPRDVAATLHRRAQASDAAAAAASADATKHGKEAERLHAAAQAVQR